MYKIVFSSQAEKDKKLLKRAGLDRRAKALLSVIAKNPFQNPPRYEKLVGDLAGFYSRRINIQHRIVYQVYPAEQTVKILTMWATTSDPEPPLCGAAFLLRSFPPSTI